MAVLPSRPQGTTVCVCVCVCIVPCVCAMCPHILHPCGYSGNSMHHLVSKVSGLSLQQQQQQIVHSKVSAALQSPSDSVANRITG